MAKKETYDKLFWDVAEAVKFATIDKGDAVAVAKIILRSKYAILRKYSDINRYVKAECMVGGIEKLDRHKCAACFMVAFEKRLIVTDDNKKYEVYREKIAIIAAMTVLTSFAENEAKENGNHDMLNHIEANGGFVTQKSTQDKKPYDEIWAMELRRIYTNKQERESALSVAKDLFGIEEYNKELAGNAAHGGQS
jgi:hypothetical protein